MDYHGQMALQAGLLVAFTQIIPEHQVQVFGVLKVRVKVDEHRKRLEGELIPYHSVSQWHTSWFAILWWC